MQRIETLTTTTFVLAALRREIFAKYPNLSFVYSENLDYFSSEIENRSDSNTSPVNRTTSLPLLSFNRSPLRRSQLGSRGNRFSAYAPLQNTINEVTKYRTAHCEFDFNFSFIDKDISTIESFELDYMSREGLGRITQFDVDFSSADPNLGIFRYYITWSPDLNSLQMSTQEDSYVSINGSATVVGFFVSLYGTADLITSINLSLKDQFNSIEQVTIS